MLTDGDDEANSRFSQFCEWAKKFDFIFRVVAMHTVHNDDLTLRYE